MGVGRNGVKQFNCPPNVGHSEKSRAPKVGDHFGRSAARHKYIIRTRRPRPTLCTGKRTAGDRGRSVADSSRQFWRISIDYGRHTPPELSRWCTVRCADGSGTRPRPGGRRGAEPPTCQNGGLLLVPYFSRQVPYFSSQTPFLPTPIPWDVGGEMEIKV